ncbi:MULTISPECIES: RraA family protein [Aneurinibacillus]|uniref:Putative 4-hydroxy-4-methyl-2-oxoglutarate aldolase n=1 Tax=Aneurinibacillus thermoaerophilus TaxID=143495 RepID=A0A1G7YZ73_ANETH|nr:MULTISPECIES: RraA family protein [Aneurinibacillus]AMA73133.1 regulator [Aneurinibacillus sp. XH2]MED0674451.1 RraA family protein [Aneurinibacillus thermoaerophilus]MED0678468.1 RraA family protein [Aneurinibacillus thermoaerophilus]MED0736008.1 RraA family protein [Aneurinibacillus thermoaerophilus]MED0756155.1 RraA family protein [Aneurinibacillus thermoaerophilus]
MNDIIEKLRETPTTCVSDAMQGLNNLHPDIKPLKEEYKIVGRAFTVKTAAGDNFYVLKAIREAKPGDILVIDAKGDTYRAIAGDFVVGMAQTLGIQGIVVDGVIRDVMGIKNLNFPVFCKGTTVAASNKVGIGETNVPISCGGVTVHPNDIIIGDVDGVVVIPQTIEQDVLNKAVKKMKKDQEREESVLKSRESVIQYLDNILSK